MKRFFPALFWGTQVFGYLKVIAACYGLFNSDMISKYLIAGAGIESIVQSQSMAKNMAASVVPFIWGFLITSLLLLLGSFLMKKEKRIGFYLYTATNAFLILFFFYAGFNMFPGLEYIAVIPFFGILLHVWVMDAFWHKTENPK
ncbi:MAG: hypothetical protein MH137_12970 [Flavobacteriales bacterium]|nr:hypothetical protein [Flavobacteriales bacterium]